MHPIFARSRRLGLYLLLFLQAGALLGEILAQNTEMTRPLAMLVAVPLMVLHSFSCLASWYLCRSLPLVGENPARPVLALAAAGALAAGLVLGLAGLWVRTLSQIPPAATGAFAAFGQGRFLIFVFSWLIFSLVAMIHYLFIAAEESRIAIGRAFEMRIQAREAELRALKAQINPHFLFNSLHSISSLVTGDPPRARKMCIHLADFLRQSLRVGALDSIPLAKEVALVESYLEVERVRFGDRLRIDLRVSEDCAELAVPPLILQPLVENAVVHGIQQLLDGGSVSISAKCLGERLRIVVENDCEARRKTKPGEGIGLENVRRRLEARYGDHAWLNLEAPRLGRGPAAEGADVGRLVSAPQQDPAAGRSRFRATVSLPIDRSSE